jgi:hypothetical protein
MSAEGGGMLDAGAKDLGMLGDGGDGDSPETVGRVELDGNGALQPAKTNARNAEASRVRAVTAMAERTASREPLTPTAMD